MNQIKAALILGSLMLFVFRAAQSEINGPPIVDNHYKLDLRQGPIVGSARQVALGGAYIGVAEGIHSLASSPAGVAFRPARSKSRFDWDWTAGLNDLNTNDFDNNGTTPPDYRGHLIRNLGIMAQYGAWGIGLLNNAEILKLDGPSGQKNEYVLSGTSIDLGRQFLDRELTMGIGARITAAKVREERFGGTLGKISGVGFEMGGVWHPQRGPFRIGAEFSSAIKSSRSLSYTSSNPVTVNGIIVPEQVVLPARMGVGASYSVKSAPFWKDHKWMISGDIVLTEPTANAVGVESVLAQKKQSIKSQTTTSVRIGSELEAWPGRLRLRLGSYYEPANFDGVSGRTHLTGGCEIRLFHTNIWGEYDWGFTYTIDSARDYLNNFISIGFWYD